MHRFLWLSFITITMIISGCESPDQPEAKTTPHQVVKEKKPVDTTPVQPAASPLEAAKNAADKAETRSEQVDQEAKAIAGDVEQAAPAMTKPVVVAAEKVTSETEKTVETVTGSVEKASENVGTNNKPAYPEEIILEASNGNVTFTHGAHTDTVACSTCHGEGTPSSFGIDKDIAHKLCKGCHKDGGAGPTGCRDCHIK